MSLTLEHLKGLAYKVAPPLHPAWVQAEEELKRSGPPSGHSIPPLKRQGLYAQECRNLLARATAPGARDHALSRGIHRTEFTIPSSVDGFPIPVLQLDTTETKDQEPEGILIYYHGGGLHVGEADSEEFSCRRLIKSSSARLRLYSIGYRLMPTYTAETCVSDALDGFRAVSSQSIKSIVVGSSSGGQLAATVAQQTIKGSIHGLLLRCPVSCDPSEGKKYLPEWLRPYHTSLDPSFITYLFQELKRAVPRDGLDTLPLETTKQELAGHPRTWVQLCTNDTLYADGLCYAMALVDAGVDVQVDVQKGWPHTFWLKTPQLEKSFEADEAAIEGLNWLLK